MKLGVIGCVSAGSTAQSCLRLLSITHPILLRLLNIWERRICRTCLFTSDCAVFSGFLTAFGACEHSLALPLPHTWQLCQCSERILSGESSRVRLILCRVSSFHRAGAGADTGIRSWFSARQAVGAGAAMIQEPRALLRLGWGRWNHRQVQPFILWVLLEAWPGSEQMECARFVCALLGQVRHPSCKALRCPRAGQPGTLHTTPGNLGRELQALHLQNSNVCFVAWDALRMACLCK